MKTIVKKYLKDIIIISSILIFSILLFVVFNLIKKEGNMIEIKVDNQIVGTYSLLENREIPIYQDGDICNLVVIEDQKVYMIEASCPDHLCVNQGKKHYVNETITCLPNKVVIKVIGKSDVDIVV